MDMQPTRRGFLDWLIGFCSTVTGAVLTVPALAYLWPAARGGASEDVEVPNASTLTHGQSATIQVRGKAVIVVREHAGFTAFSAVCTHLGCLVKWDGPRSEFRCPCHAAVFDKNGAVVSGPAPAPLPTYRVKEVGGKVYVSAA